MPHLWKMMLVVGLVMVVGGMIAVGVINEPSLAVQNLLANVVFSGACFAAFSVVLLLIFGKERISRWAHQKTEDVLTFLHQRGL